MRVGIDARKIADFGIGTYIRGLVESLAVLPDMEVVAFAPANVDLPADVERVPISAPHYSIREMFVLGHAADRARLDVFHAPHYVIPATKTPVVVTIHDLIHLHQPLRNPLARPYARVMLRRAVRKSARVLTVSDAVAAELTRELDCAASKIVVTPNGVDARFSPASAQRRHFLFVGNDKPHKNAVTLVAAFQRVRRELPGATLVLAGGEFSRYRGVEGVAVRGFVGDDELVALYRGAIALVMPSIEEGFGLPAAEAMACGTAVITSTAPALVEVTGDAALHVAARDEAALADAMLRVARDEALRASLASRGLARARSFTWRACAEKTAAAYRAATR